MNIMVLYSLSALAGPAAMVRPARPRPYRFFEGEKLCRLDSNLDR